MPKLLICPRPLKVEVRLDATPHAPVCWAIGTVSGAFFVKKLVRVCVLYVTPLGNSHDWLENSPFSIGNTSIPIHLWWMFVCQSWGVGFVGYFKIPIFKVRRNLGSHNYSQQQPQAASCFHDG